MLKTSFKVDEVMILMMKLTNRGINLTRVILLILSFSTYGQAPNPAQVATLVSGSWASLYSPQNVFVAGNYAYLTTYYGVEIVDITNPSNPIHLTFLSGGTAGGLLSNPNAVYVLGNYAYITASSTLQIFDVTNPASPQLVSSIANGTGGALLNGAGALYVSGGYAYVASEVNTYTSGALEVVNVSNPLSPVHQGSVTSASLNYPFFVTISGNYAYMASENNGSMQIINIANPNTPFLEGSLGDYPSSIFVSGSYAYVTTYNNTLDVVNIANPLSPIKVGSIANGTNGAVINTPRSVFVAGNLAYIVSYNPIVTGTVIGSLEIVDISNPVLPSHLGNISDGGGAAPFLNTPKSIFVSGNYAYIASSNSNALEVINISTPSTPAHAGSIADGDGLAPALYDPKSVFVAGNYAYIASNESHALEILDVSNPSAPVHKGNLVNGPAGVLLDYPKSVFVAGNYAYLVCSLGNASTGGLEIVDVTNPAAPVHAGSISNGTGGAIISGPTSVFVAGKYAYVTSAYNNANALEIIDVSNPANPVHVGSISDGGGSQAPYLNNPTSVFVAGNYAYVTAATSYEGASSNGNLEIIDISNPASPVDVADIFDGDGSAPYLDYPSSVSVSGNLAYVTSYYSNALEIIDVSSPAAPVHKGSIQDGDGATPFLYSPNAVYVSGNYAFVASYGSNALEIVNTSSPATPVHEGSITNGTNGAMLSSATSVFYSKGFAFLTSEGSNALDIVAWLPPPIATAATLTASTEFTANWNLISGATNYFLDVATDSLFSNILTAYSNVSVTNNTQTVSGLAAGTIYYYRVRAANASYSSTSSNFVAVNLVILSQSISFIAAPTQYVGSTYSLTATASSGLTVNFTSSPNGTINGNSVTFNSVGADTITAYQVGNGQYAAAVPVVQVLCINPTISAGASTLCNQAELIATPFSLNATYQWYEGGKKIVGATRDSLTTYYDGNYTVQYVSGSSLACPLISIGVAMTTLYSDNVPSIISSGNPVSKLSTTYPAASYQWYINDKLIVGADTAALNVWYNGAYYLIAQLANGCQYRSNTIAVNATSYPNLGRLGQDSDSVRLVPPNEALTVFPNPAKGNVTISTGSLSASGIEIYNNEGQVLLNKNFDSPTNLIFLDVASWSSGLYIISVICDNNKIWQKLVKY